LIAEFEYIAVCFSLFIC